MKLEGCEIRKDCRNISATTGCRRAFTLVEMLVVISIMALLLGILMPALNLAKRQARAVLGMHNQKELVNGLHMFSMDNRDRYPDSVATVGVDDRWNWSDPIKMIGDEARSPKYHRSMSAYLYNYIPDAKIMSCPSAPKQHKYLQEAWEAGDDWDNPETDPSLDAFGGTYCFYWSYIGYLAQTDTLFRGPFGPAGGRRYSKLLVSDYFGYDHWRSPDAFGSCEKFDGADVVEETNRLSSYWTVEDDDPEESKPELTLRAGFIDGHVETYSSSDVVPMKISMTPEGAPPYPDSSSPGGIFYLPKSALK